jgi:hypothetical protein
MNLPLDPEKAAILVDRTVRLAGSARELALFGETDPFLASECGVELGALEARMILSSGAVDRIARAASEAIQSGRTATISADDIEALSRLEGVVSLGSSKIELKMAAMDASASQEPITRITNLLGLAGGAYGLIKSIL